MSGTKAGGVKIAITNKLKYGDDYYKRIGKLGGTEGRTGGFYANRELASTAGAKGGKISKRKWTPEDRIKHGEAMRNRYKPQRLVNYPPKPTTLLGKIKEFLT